MKDISNNIRSILPKDNTPLLVPSLCNGSATATQSNNIITVNCANPHNIPSTAAARISNVGVSVFLLFEDIVGRKIGTDIVSQWCSNIVITSTTSFTCTSSISQTVTTPTAIYPLALANVDSYNAVYLRGMGIDIQPNVLKAGSSLTYNGFIERANIGTVRTNYYALGAIPFHDTSYIENTSLWYIFGGDSMSNNTGTSRSFYKKIGFFGDVDYVGEYNFADNKYTDYITTRYSPGSNDTITAGRSVSTTKAPVSLQYGFILMPVITFSGTSINDYVMWSMSRLEINQ